MQKASLGSQRCSLHCWKLIPLGNLMSNAMAVLAMSTGFGFKAVAHVARARCSVPGARCPVAGALGSIDKHLKVKAPAMDCYMQVLLSSNPFS